LLYLHPAEPHRFQFRQGLFHGIDQLLHIVERFEKIIECTMAQGFDGCGVIAVASEDDDIDIACLLPDVFQQFQTRSMCFEMF
jgi:hypothetical protein